jgi:hypothetical protein
MIGPMILAPHTNEAGSGHMRQIPVLNSSGGRRGPSSDRGKPILQFRELEPDWERYNAWRASLIEPYSKWMKRRKQLRLDEAL